MPREFSTPMFWTEDERSALKGTDIEGMPTNLIQIGMWADDVERIGKDQAEEEYRNTIEPLLKVSLLPTLRLFFSLISLLNNVGSS